MGYFLLLVAIIGELAGTALLKVSAGLTRPIPAVSALGSYLICLTCLNFSLKLLEFSFVYTAWAAIGVTLSTIVGYVIFDEPLTLTEIFWTGFTLIGVLGLTVTKTGG